MAKKVNRTAKSLMLKNIPDDVRCIIEQEQTKLKEEKGVTVYGKELTIYSIIRQSKRCEENDKPARVTR